MRTVAEDAEEVKFVDAAMVVVRALLETVEMPFAAAEEMRGKHPRKTFGTVAVVVAVATCRVEQVRVLRRRIARTREELDAA